MLGRNQSVNIHRWAEERLSEYLDNRLAANEHTRLEQHLRECAACRASLESLRWTIALLRQAPAPVSTRAFTLPVPAPRATRHAFAFGFAQFGAALATVLLLAVIGVDVIMQWSGMGAPLAMPAKEFSEPALEIAAAPTMPVPDPADVLVPTPSARPPSVPLLEATKPAEPTKAPLPTIAPAAAAMRTSPTPDAKSANDTERKSPSATLPRVGVALLTPSPTFTPTMTLAPTLTPGALPTPTAPTPTRVAQARPETRAPQPATVPYATPSLLPLLRVIEVVLFLLALFFGVLVVILWRKR